MVTQTDGFKFQVRQKSDGVGHSQPCLMVAQTGVFFNFRADRKVMMWDIRRAKGSLMALDQHNGEQISNRKDGEAVCVQVSVFVSVGVHLYSTV